MVFIWPITPETGMINFCEAVVVQTLYEFSNSPEDECVLQKVNDEIIYFTQSIKSNKLTLPIHIMDGVIVCYSKSKRRPMELNDAVDKIAIDDTSDIQFYGHDFLKNGRYANNFLPDVIENARVIIRDNPLIRETVVPNLIITSAAIETTDFSHDKVEATRNSNSNDGKITKVRRINKLRVNSLDASIMKAIDRAKSLDMGTVFIQLKEIALSGEAPFNGIVEGSALQYTNDNDVLKLLTKDSLGKRLKKHTL